MLEKKLEIWSIDPITKKTLIKLNLLVSILDYLKDGPPCFVGFPDGNTKVNRKMIGLNTAVAISDNHQQLNPPNINNLKAKRVKKKKEKAQKP